MLQVVVVSMRQMNSRNTNINRVVDVGVAGVHLLSQLRNLPSSTNRFLRTQQQAVSTIHVYTTNIVCVYLSNRIH